MKTFKKILLALLLIITLTIGLTYALGYGYVLKAVRIVYGTGHTTTFLDDYTYFDNRTIEKSPAPTPWAVHPDYNKVPATPALKALHKRYGTTAFLIIKGDSLWHEQYFEGYTTTIKSNSFSMAKSYVCALLGKAIAEGYIKGLDQKVGDFLPEFRTGLAQSLTVGDLASMASGSNWDEAYYNPFSITTRAYFDTDFRKAMLGVKIVTPPGKEFVYQSGNTLLLGMVIEKATKRSLSGYLTERLWQPMGCESDALWQLDSKEDGLEKAYCCIASNARDFARLGKLYRDKGRWNGTQLLDSTFVETSLRPRFADAPEYGYGMWLLDYKGKHFFMMRGHLGQYVIVAPTDGIIIVRLGREKSIKAGENNLFSRDIYGYINEAYTMLQQPL
jgi:beta-lactamase